MNGRMVRIDKFYLPLASPSLRWRMVFSPTAYIDMCWRNSSDERRIVKPETYLSNSNKCARPKILCFLLDKFTAAQPHLQPTCKPATSMLHQEDTRVLPSRSRRLSRISSHLMRWCLNRCISFSFTIPNCFTPKAVNAAHLYGQFIHRSWT